MRKANMIGLGMATQLVSAINTVSNTQTATGSSSQANSFAIVDDVTIFTTAPGNSGARLPANALPGDDFRLLNGDSNTMLIYPPGTGKLNNGSASASLSLPTLKGALCTAIDGGANSSFMVIVGA